MRNTNHERKRTRIHRVRLETNPTKVLFFFFSSSEPSPPPPLSPLSKDNLYFLLNHRPMHCAAHEVTVNYHTMCKLINWDILIHAMWCAAASSAVGDDEDNGCACVTCIRLCVSVWRLIAIDSKTLKWSLFTRALSLQRTQSLLGSCATDAHNYASSVILSPQQRWTLKAIFLWKFMMNICATVKRSHCNNDYANCNSVTGHDLSESVRHSCSACSRIKKRKKEQTRKKDNNECSSHGNSGDEHDCERWWRIEENEVAPSAQKANEAKRYLLASVRTLHLNERHTHTYRMDEWLVIARIRLSFWM